MIKAIIFDFAGVIGEDGYWVWLRENLADFETKKHIFDKTANQVDKGELSEKEFVGFVSEHTKRDTKDIWPEVKEKILLNHELIGIIKSLKKNYKTALLSNFVFEWLNEILTDNNLYDEFDEVIISAKHGMIKPDAEIFLKMIDLLGIKPEEAIFIDDRQYQVDGAKKLGIKAFLYKDNNTLIKDLQSEGVRI